MLKNSEYIEKKVIIEDKVNTKNLGKKAQIGFDLTVKNIYEIQDFGFVSRNKTYVPNYQKIFPKKLKYKDIEFEGWFLPKGNYILETNEGCEINKNNAGYILQRSSLNRCGVQIISSLWDPGFTSRNGQKVNSMQVRLIVSNEKGFYLEKNSRVCQMIICECEDSEMYDGQFQHGIEKSKLVK